MVIRMDPMMGKESRLRGLQEVIPDSRPRDLFSALDDKLTREELMGPLLAYPCDKLELVDSSLSILSLCLAKAIVWILNKWTKSKQKRTKPDSRRKECTRAEKFSRNWSTKSHLRDATLAIPSKLIGYKDVEGIQRSRFDELRQLLMDGYD
ncbi:hypothetical protein Tco_0906907 [Tanacetum coccineum]|uniref:Uncharacterized protein n=1 Tax=Tanacetum coccineum TaxID=301880 RepID=A0ABQ5CJ69_9ASTR